MSRRKVKETKIEEKIEEEKPMGTAEEEIVAEETIQAVPHLTAPDQPMPKEKPLPKAKVTYTNLVGETKTLEVDVSGLEHIVKQLLYEAQTLTVEKPKPT